MKNFKILLIAFALFTLNATAKTFSPVKPSAQLRADIVDIIGTNCPYESDKDECTAEVIFTVNNEREIVIISVTSENPGAEEFIKSKLNYKKVNHKPGHAGELFLLPLRMVKNS